MKTEPEATHSDLKRTLSGLRKQRAEMAAFLLGELCLRKADAFLVGAKFTPEEIRTLLSIFPTVNMDAYLFHDGNEDDVLIQGTVGDQDDPAVFGNFAGNLALALLEQATGCQLESTYFPSDLDHYEFTGVLCRKLAALSSEESLALMVTLAAELMMLPWGVRSDYGYKPGVIPPPTETYSAGHWYVLALIETTFPTSSSAPAAPTRSRG